MMNSIIEMDRRKEELQVLREIKHMHSKLKRLYEKLDEFDYDTSYIVTAGAKIPTCRSKNPQLD